MTEQLYTNYRQYKAWEDFLGTLATERTHKVREAGEYYKSLTFKIGTMTVRVNGPWAKLTRLEG